MNEINNPALVPAATAGNLTNLIAERAWFEPERIIMSRPLGDGWQSVTAKEAEAQIRETAKGLIAAGVQIGDRVAIMSRTRYEWTILDFAIWFAAILPVLFLLVVNLTNVKKKFMKLYWKPIWKL